MTKVIMYAAALFGLAFGLSLLTAVLDGRWPRVPVDAVLLALMVAVVRAMRQRLAARDDATNNLTATR